MTAAALLNHGTYESICNALMLKGFLMLSQCRAVLWRYPEFARFYPNHLDVAPDDPDYWIGKTWPLRKIERLTILAFCIAMCE